MTRRTAAPDAEPCLLCERTVPPVWNGEEWVAIELCGACDEVFWSLAQRLAGADQ